MDSENEGIGVYEISNFVSSKYIARLSERINEKTNKWVGDRQEILDLFVEPDLLEPYYKLLQNLFTEQNYKIKKEHTIQKSCGGFGLDSHADEQGLKTIKYGTILYLNNNYTGGYLVYPTLNIAIKPEPGLLVIHKGNIPHFVANYNNDGERYFISRFLCEEESI